MRTLRKIFLSSLCAAFGCMAFLAGIEQAGAVVPIIADVAKNPNEVGTPVCGRTNPTTIVVNLAAVEVVAHLTKDKAYLFWAFAPADSTGQPTGKPTVPGPMIRCMEGDTVVVNLTSNLPNIEPHNIDLHAVMGPGGGAAVTNVQPDGMTKTLQFTALRQGAFIYHCAGEGMPWEHVAHGMFGLILVEPRGGLSQFVEGMDVKEFYVGQSEWYPTNEIVIDPAISTSPFFNLDMQKASDEHPDIFSFNGHQNALTDASIQGEAMLARPGQFVRVFFVNGGPNIGSNFHIIGQIFDRVVKGSKQTPELNEETVYVAPGSAATFEMSALVPGQYLLVDHALFRVPKGAGGHMHVLPECASVADPGSWTCGGWPFSIFSPPAHGTGH